MSSNFRLPPVLEWLRTYQTAWLPADLAAGFTLAAYAVPVSLAYASLAGLPPHYGVYCYLLAGPAYALLGTSRQLACGPTSAIAMLVGTSIAALAADDPARIPQIAALTALLTAILCVLAWALRLSVLMSFVSETILVGFKAGAAVTIALTQLPKLFGVPGGGDHFFERVWILAGQLPAVNFYVLGFGLVALLLLLLAEKFLPGRPAALMVVALSIVVLSQTSLEDRGVKVLGDIPAGLPQLQLPSLRPADVDGVIPLACACFLLSYVESVSAARALAAKNGYEIDARRELLGLGAANVAAAFGQGFPVAGGLSQSAVNDKAGAKSPLALVFASLALGLCLLFLTGWIRNLPTVVLASVVLVAVRGLIDFKALNHLRRVSRFEFRIALTAFAGVLLLGMLKGVLLAAIVSLVLLITAAARPHVAFLGRIPGTGRFSDLERHPNNEVIPGVVIFRVEASLLYFNTEHIRDVVRAKLQTTESVRLVICDLSNAPHVDVAGARMLAALQTDLATRGAALRLVEAHSSVRDLLRAEGLEERTGYLGRRISIEQALEEAESTR